HTRHHQNTLERGNNRASRPLQSQQFYLRLRILARPFRKELSGKTSVVRELKIFGTSVPIGEKQTGAIQHKGLGKRLMKFAEELSKKEGAHKIVVIAAVGTRDYYRALEYFDDGAYVSKKLI
ncbi:MAG: GNAT family N-acetyltransferase, partial [Nanoarchaeota archaeon]|nr:GNAT family N-acetyltransferase [Nanoarchaeota archaeon]